MQIMKLDEIDDLYRSNTMPRVFVPESFALFLLFVYCRQRCHNIYCTWMYTIGEVARASKILEQLKRLVIQ